MSYCQGCADSEQTIAALRVQLSASERAKGITRCEWQSARDKLVEIERNLIRITGHETDYATNIEALSSERDELRSQNAALRERNAELEALLIESARSLISYEKSYGSGGGVNEAIDIALALGYDGPQSEDDTDKWLAARAAIPENAPNNLASSEVERDVKSPVSGGER